MKVLVAHPSPDVRREARTVLTEVGYRVLDADTAAAALERCRAEGPEVALIDVELCRRDQRRLLADLKGDPELAPIAVIVLDTDLEMAEALDGLGRGVHDYMRDTSPVELVARVRSASRAREVEEELRSRNEALERLANSDLLTGLPNRRALQRELSALVSSARRHGRAGAVAVVDVDGFKHVNDSLGHAAGDAAIQEVAARLSARMRKEDVVARWGGDEFLLLLPDTDAAGAAALAEGVCAAVAEEPFALAGRSERLTVSVGWAEWRGEEPEDLVAVADMALYRAKRSGGGRARGSRTPSEPAGALLGERVATAGACSPAPAAELRQDLLPPPLGRVEGAELAATILPARGVGGDVFDWSQNAGGTWWAVAHAAGSGLAAMVLAAAALSALRAERRNGSDLEDAAGCVDAAVREASGGTGRVTALLGHWDPGPSTLRWLSFGHPAPLLLDGRGGIRDLAGNVLPPLGAPDPLPPLAARRTTLRRGDGVVAYSDGVSNRRRAGGGRLGREGIAAALLERADRSASATVRAVIRAVREASDEEPDDDATVLALAAR